jgi:hypothetical protein
MEIPVRNQNLIQEEIKRRPNSCNACYHSEYRIYKTMILPMVLYVCETRSLTLREEHRARMFENRVLRRVFGLKRGELTEG